MLWHCCVGSALSCRYCTQMPSINMPSPKQSQNRRTRKILITCHNGPQEQDGTKQEVSCLCPKAIHDLPLANGEGNTKNLQTNKGNVKLYCYYKAGQTLSNLYQTIRAYRPVKQGLKFGYKHIQRHFLTANGMTDDPDGWNIISHCR